MDPRPEVLPTTNMTGKSCFYVHTSESEHKGHCLSSSAHASWGKETKLPQLGKFRALGDIRECWVTLKAIQ